jgi:dihydroflavonol-4-reductase
MNLTGLRALVLGGTGLIGSHVVRSLVARGCCVRVVSRVGAATAAPALRGVPVEIVRGDISDPDSIRGALSGIDLIFHAAAPYPTRHFGMGAAVRSAAVEMEALLRVLREAVAPELLTYRPLHADQAALEQAEMGAHVARVQPERIDEMRRIVRDPRLLALAAEGKLNASQHPSLEQCRGIPGVKRIVYTSSVTTIGRPRGSEPGQPRGVLSNESDRYDPAPHPSPYFTCKHLMEAAVARAANEGLPAVIVNPTLVVDAGDSHLTTGKLLLEVARRRMPFYLPGMIDAIAGNDVGEGHVMAAIRGRTGHRYILGHERMSLEGFLAVVAEEAGVQRPRIPCPYPVAVAISLATEWIAYLQGRRWPLFPTHGLKMLRYSPAVDSSLAVSELSLPRTPVRVAVRRALAWYREEGLLQ